ncbi:MAG: hypothetical protein QM504_12645 [Pseudomonadota bacterium]
MPLIFSGEKTNNILLQKDILQVIENIDREADSYIKNSQTPNSEFFDSIDYKTETVLTIIPQAKLRSPTVINKSVKNLTKQKKNKQPKKLSKQFTNISALLDKWLIAWSKGNVDSYITFYSKDFSPANKTRIQWIANRKQRIKPEKKIRITLSELEFNVIRKDKTIRSQFMQKYSSIHYSDFSKKQLIWKNINGTWQISSERTIQ